MSCSTLSVWETALMVFKACSAMWSMLQTVLYLQTWYKMSHAMPGNLRAVLCGLLSRFSSVLIELYSCAKHKTFSHILLVLWLASQLWSVCWLEGGREEADGIHNCVCWWPIFHALKTATYWCESINTEVSHTPFRITSSASVGSEPFFKESQ